LAAAARARPIQAATAAFVDRPLPARLSETGLYVAAGSTEIAPENLAYVPQYPLWSDAARKRRWVWWSSRTRKT